MLHAALPPAQVWPAMSHPGADLVLYHTRNGGHPLDSAERGHMGGQSQEPTGQTHGGPTYHSSGSSSHYYHSQASGGFSNFPSYTVHHQAARHPDRLGPRHPSGGNSNKRATPPSPAEARLMGAEDHQNYKPAHSVILERQLVHHTPTSSHRNSFDHIQQRQCNSSSSESRTATGPAQSRMQPPSPVSSQLPQKSAFDMTMASNRGLEHEGRTQALSTGTGRSDTVGSTTRMPSSPYQAIKQEPGSPAQYAVAIRSVKQEPNHPHSPRNINATPPPSHSQHPQHPMERKFLPSSGRTSHGSGGSGFSYPSPQSHTGGSNPISPAATIGDSSSRPMNKFRYPSGTQPVQNLSPGESTSNSAISSRESTPGPSRAMSWGGEDASAVAPNIDITQVQVKEEASASRSNMSTYQNLPPARDDYSRRPSVNISYPASTTNSHTAHTSQHLETTYSGHQSGAQSYGYHHSMPQQVSLPPRNLQGMRSVPERGHPHAVLIGQSSHGLGRPLPSNSESHGTHSNVKIGRRPAHLPKVLKFTDSTLPVGWLRKLKQRKHGKQAGRWDVYIYSPCGVKFASRKKLKSFFEKNNLNYDPEDFDFTPYGRHIDAAAHARQQQPTSETRHVNNSNSLQNASPTSSFSSVSPSGVPNEFLSPPTPHHATGHSVPRPYNHGLSHPQQFLAEFNPMMESPPNANALEVPQHQILNLSQPHSHGAATRVPHSQLSPAGREATGFPPDIANILNEPSEGQYRQSLRGYHNDLSGRQQEQTASDQMSNSSGNRTPASGEDSGPGEDNSRFITRSYNLLTTSQSDLGDMIMDDYILSE